MSLHTAPAHTVEVQTPAEAREALDAAETLGLELRNVKVRGWWEGRDGPEPSRGSAWDLQPKTHNAQKWFYLAGNGESTFAAKPARSSVDSVDDGTLELRFDTEDSA